MVGRGNRLRTRFFLRLQQEFYNVPHAIVGGELRSLNINPFVINWIVSFLSNKKQRVVVGGFVTKIVSVNRAVPQVTVRGPVLFSVMVNDITPVDPERNLLVQILVKYAGDLSYA